MRSDQQTDEVEHVVRGVGDETRVGCGRRDLMYGPHPDAIENMRYCPYCGAKAWEGDHGPSIVAGEVFCPDSSMSTYRYCPGCGDGVDNGE